MSTVIYILDIYIYIYTLGEYTYHMNTLYTYWVNILYTSGEYIIYIYIR